jgi:hypothetical protein
MQGPISKIIISKRARGMTQVIKNLSSKPSTTKHLNRQSNKLMANELNSFQKYKWLINTQKIFNIFNHQGYANPNYIDIPSHPSQNGCHEGKQRTNGSEDAWTIYTIGPN